MLVHYHATATLRGYRALVAEHSERIRKQIDLREEDESDGLRRSISIKAKAALVAQTDAALSLAIQAELDAMARKRQSGNARAPLSRSSRSIGGKGDGEDCRA